MQKKSKLRNETDVHNSLYRSLELVKTRNRMESERLRTLVDSHIEKHKQYELKTLQRATDAMRRRLDANESRRRELRLKATQDKAEDERLRQFREAARARKSFIQFLIEHVRNKEVRTPVDEADEEEEEEEEEEEQVEEDEDGKANGDNGGGRGAGRVRAAAAAASAGKEGEELAKTRHEFAKRMAALTVSHPTALMRQTVAMFGGPAKPKSLRVQIGSFSLKRVEARRHEADRKKSVLESSEEAYKVVKILNDEHELQKQLIEAGKAGYLRVAQPTEDDDTTLPVMQKTSST